MKVLKILIYLGLFLVFFQDAVGDPVKILVVVTNHSELGQTGKKTGYYLSEVSHPYYKFKEAGFNVDFVSPKGGMAPMDPKSLNLQDPLNKKFYADEKLMAQLEKTKALFEVHPKNYSAIVFAGGHGTMWDFPNSEALNQLTASIFEQGGVVAAVCHGPAALVNVRLSNKKYLLDQKNVTSFTNKEEKLVKLTEEMPFLLEDKMKKRGARFKAGEPWKQNVVIDGRLVTGQNPNSASQLGAEVVKLLKK